MVGGTCGSSKGSRNAFAVAVRASRRTHSSRAFGVDLQPRRAAITVNNSMGADLLAAIKYDLLTAIASNSSRGAIDLLVAINTDPLTAITSNSSRGTIDPRAAIIFDLLAAIVI